ncbi:MAG: ATP-binding protein [Thermodesulfovibrionales bacterium]
MTREKYIEFNLLKLLHNWGNFALLSGTIIIIGLALLDITVTPENLKTFIIYRIVTATIFFLTYLFNRRVISLRRLYTSQIIATVSVTAMVALMIAKYGGHTSPYYGGIILTLIYVITVTPPMKKIGETIPGIFFASLIYALYVIPIVIYDTITNSAFFINANFFIIASAVSLIFIRHFVLKRFRNEFSLQYDLEQQKRQLSLYSDELKEDVIRKAAALQTSEIRFKELFENANDGIAVMNKDGIIIDVNKRFSEITGFDRNSLIGTNIKIFEVNGENDEGLTRMEMILSGEPVLFEIEHYRRNGEKIDLEVSSKAINIDGEVYIQSFYRDITEKKRLQSQLFQAQKMESIGILAGSIAHDFNNIITSILSNIEMLKNSGDLDERGRQRVNIIENSAKRANAMIARLLGFARMKAIDKKATDLKKVIRETIDLMSATLVKRGIVVTMNLDDIPLVTGDSNLLSQAIMNLVVNAIDAMPSGGRISISTSLQRRKEGTSTKPVLGMGDYILLRFSDSGKGIPSEIKDRIFEPFFTTKSEGRGTGLGLSIVYRIIEEHNGSICVESRPGRGTTFNIYLPVSEEYIPERQERMIDLSARPLKILVIDDEIGILTYIKDILESKGYSVLSMNDPFDVYKMDREAIKGIDLLITDIMMPNINGKELIRYIKTIKPSIKVIAISAYDIWNIGKKDSDIDAFVGKPFEAVYLLSVLRRVMESQGQWVNIQ